jgi:hypothetical protein
MTAEKFLYIFVDEGGNFDFSRGGTSHFTLSCLSRERPFPDYSEFIGLKYDLVEQGMDIEYFHASEDKQAVRDLVFQIIQRNLVGMRVDALIVEKRKTAHCYESHQNSILGCWVIFCAMYWSITD